MTSDRTKSRKVKPPNLPLAGTELLTRGQVAKTLGCSPATVRRMEGVTLHPVEDEAGVHRFAPIEVFQLMRERSARVVDPSVAGERDARAFEMFDGGLGPREVVTTLRLPIDLVLKLFDQWREAGRRDLVIPPVCRGELEKCLGTVKDAAHVTQLVRSLDAEHERVKFENETLSNQMGNVLSIVGELAARYCEVEDILPVLRNELDAERIERLDHAVNAYKQQLAASNTAVEP